MTFPLLLLSLPPEIILNLIHHINDASSSFDPDASSSTFPKGPTTNLLAFSETCIFLHTLCRPLIWRSIDWRFEPRSIVLLNTTSSSSSTSIVVDDDEESSWDFKRTSTRLDETIQSRGLFTLLKLIHSAKGSERGSLPIKAFSYTSPQDHLWDPVPIELKWTERELKSLIEILKEQRGDLQVVFLKEVDLSSSSSSSSSSSRGVEEEEEGEMGNKLMKNLKRMKKLSALRLNSVKIKKSCFLDLEESLDGQQSSSSFSNLRTLQIMHGSSKLIELVRYVPKVESLLLWPTSRRFDHSIQEVIIGLLPRLKLLSLDSVNEPSMFDRITKAFETLLPPLPLSELFLEGRQSLPQRTQLIESLSHLPHLTHLALYHLRSTRPCLLQQIFHSVPHLKALTLVYGDTSTSVTWPESVHDYVKELKKFTKLEFFGWDRRTTGRLRNGLTNFEREENLNEERLNDSQEEEEEGENRSQLRLEYKTLGLIGKQVTNLKEAVCITQDVSEGSSGYFAEYSTTTTTNSDDGHGHDGADDERRVQGEMGGINKRSRSSSKRMMKVRKKTVKDFLIGFDRWCIIKD